MKAIIAKSIMPIRKRGLKDLPFFTLDDDILIAIYKKKKYTHTKK